MKHIATLLILFSFSVMAVFGFVVMTHAMVGDTGVGCFAGLVGGEDCPLGATDIAIHHISAYQVFSSSPIPVGLTLLGVMLVGLVFATWFFTDPRAQYRAHGSARLKHRHLENYFSSINVFLRWLALLEFSPAV